jgi:hypothetical protein
MWMANPVVALGNLHVPFRLEATELGLTLMALLGIALALTTAQLDSGQPPEVVAGLAVQVLGAGLAILSGDMLLAVLMWQVADLGRWLGQGRVPLWELVGSLAVMAGALQLSLASGGSSWEDLRGWGVHPASGWLLGAGLGLKLGLFPAMAARKNGRGPGSLGFAAVANFGLAYSLATRLMQFGVNVAGAFGPWATITLVLSLLAWSAREAIETQPGAVLTTAMGSGLALLISKGNAHEVSYAFAAVAAVVYSACAGIGKPLAQSLAIPLLSYLLSLSLMWSVSKDPTLLMAILAIVVAGIAGWTVSIRMSAFQSGVALASGSIVLAALPSIGNSTVALLSEAVAFGTALVLIVVALGIAAAVTAAAKLRLNGALRPVETDTDPGGPRMRFAVLEKAADGACLENAVHAWLLRLSAAVERGLDPLGERLALTWIVIIGILVFVLVLR